VVPEIAQGENLALRFAQFLQAPRNVRGEFLVARLHRRIGGIARDKICQGALLVGAEHAIQRVGLVAVAAKKITVTVA